MSSSIEALTKQVAALGTLSLKTTFNFVSCHTEGFLVQIVCFSYSYSKDHYFSSSPDLADVKATPRLEARTPERAKMRKIYDDPPVLSPQVLYVQEVVTQPKILNRTILSNMIHVT